MEAQINLNTPVKMEYTFYKKNGILHFGKITDAVAANNEETENKSNAGKFHCNICSKYYLSTDSLRNHKRKAHGVSSKGDYKKIQCNFCDKAFSTVERVNKHIHVVHKENKCDLCGKKFNSKGYMKQHNCSYKCDTCGKSFSQEEYMKKHIVRVHEDNKCNICGKVFN